MREELVTLDHRRSEPNHPAVRLDELCEAIDAPFRTEAQCELIPPAAHGLIWGERDDQGRIRMGDANGRTRLARALRRDLNAKSRWHRESQLMPHGAKPCGLIDLPAH